MLKVKSVSATVWLMAGIAFLAVPRQAAADVVHADHVIIQGNACIGSSDCVDERFFIGDVDIVDGAPDMLFEDTSSGEGDWRILVNSGVFSIMKRPDGGGETTMFRISEGAPANSLYVDSSGEVGFGTSTPNTSLHIVDAFPIIRLESDFHTSTWEIGPSFCTTPGVGCNLAIGRPGATPFELDPQSPDNSLVIDQVGAVGLGTESPAAALHVKRSDGTAQVLVEETSGASAQRTLFKIKNKGQTEFRIENTDTANEWIFGLRSDNVFVIAEGGAGGKAFQFSGNSGNLVLSNGDFITESNTYPDYVFEPGYELESIEQHAAYMWENSHLPAVGSGKGKKLSLGKTTAAMLEELEKAHIYIEQLNERRKQEEAAIEQLNAIVKDKVTQLAQVQSENAKLAKRLDRLEALLLAEDR